VTSFVGRVAELDLLEREWRSEKSSLVPIYGRRRVGKSELILHFLRGKKGVYYLGKKAPAALQIRELLGEASIALGEPLLAEIDTRDWKRALRAMVERHRGPEKLVLVLDELQWIAGVSPELPSVLQELWDRLWKRAGNVMLILCGSFVGFMEREILGRKSPLFGRRTAQILLRPFGHREAAAFHARWSVEERAKAYFVCGGVPLYLSLFDSELSVSQNIERSILDEHAPLFREPDFLLREELRDVESYYAMLLAIASGHGTYRAIAETTGLPERSLHYYAQQLVELGYVARRHPLTGAPPSAKSVRYVLDDPLLRFWFRFVYPNQSYLAHMGATRGFRDRVRPELDSYYGSCFERLCREALPSLYSREGVTASFEIGEYWDRHVQIDVVGLRDDGWTDLGECRWGTVRSLPAVAAELEARVASYPNRRNATIGRRLFVRQRPKRAPAPSGVRVHALSDLY
jgi:AAA+ ATPase superfamily predicted ATPase